MALAATAAFEFKISALRCVLHSNNFLCSFCRRGSVCVILAGVSSTGVVSINAVLLPESYKVLVWSRVHMDGSKDNYEPGVMGADGVPEVSAVYDTVSGMLHLCSSLVRLSTASIEPS